MDWMAAFVYFFVVAFDFLFEINEYSVRPIVNRDNVKPICNANWNELLVTYDLKLFIIVSVCIAFIELVASISRLLDNCSD